jgi:Tfp pilus assembly protein PilN
MRPVNLDYHPAPRRFTLGIATLLGGALLAVFALTGYAVLRSEVSALDAKVAQARSAQQNIAAATASTPRDAQAAAADSRVAQAALQRLQRPWDALLGALESVQAQGVALLAIEPDAEKSVLKLTAEAKSDSAMLDYVERLQTVGVLGNVTLVNHQVQTGDPSKPIRFAVLASWIGRS